MLSAVRVAAYLIDGSQPLAQALERFDFSIFFSVELLELLHSVTDQAVTAAQDCVLFFEDMADFLAE